MIPDVGCSVDASCAINPSEDPGRVAAAVSNVVGAPAQARRFSAAARTDGLASLVAVRDAAHSRRQQAAYRRSLEGNRDGGATGFYLNKQAAFAGVIALCREADESPLGPITVRLESTDIGAVISWLVSK